MMNIERIKSTLMLALSLVTILLVTVTWNIDFKNNDLDSIKINSVEIDDVHNLISPFKVQINLGGDKWASFFHDLNGFFEVNVKTISDAIIQSDKSYEISKEEYIKLMNKKSVEFSFKNPIKTEYLLSIINNKMLDIKFPLDKVDKILLVYDDSKSIYLKNDERIIKIDNEFKIYDFDELFIDLANQQYISYQRLSQRFLIPNDENIVVPKGKVPAIPIQYTQEIFNSKDIKINEILRFEKVRKISEKIFGSRMNFVRTAVGSNDTILQIYGYGKSVMEISSDGSLIYTESINSQKISKNVLEDLKLAKYWLNRINLPEDVVLSDIEVVDTSTKKGHIFKFYRIIDLMSSLNKNFEELIEVQILNSRIAYMKLNISDIVRKNIEMENISINSFTNEQLYDMLDSKENYDRFYMDYIEDSKKLEGEGNGIAPQNLLSQINNFNIVYYKLNNEYRPAFLIGIGKRFYMIDFYRREIVN